MEKELNELAVKMEDADNEEVEEELNPELQRELCLAVLCERMDKSNYRWEMYGDDEWGLCQNHCLGWEYKTQKEDTDAVFYDPKLAAEFILSGKEPFQAFMDFCRSVKTLQICVGCPRFVFDKPVFVTKKPHIHLHNQEVFKSEECFFVQTLFKYIKCLEFCNEEGFECFCSIFPHLSEMKNLDELVINHIPFGDWEDYVSPVFELLEMKQMRTIQAVIKMFDRLDGKLKNYKLEKMVIIITGCLLIPYKMEDVCRLHNFSPLELELRIDSLGAWENVYENNAFADTEKLTIATSLMNWDHTLCGKLKEKLSSADEFICSAQKQFPMLQEIVFRWIAIEVRDFNDPDNSWKTVADLCSDFAKKYHGKLDVNFVFSWAGKIYEQSGGHEYMKKQFPGETYEVRERYGHTAHVWKNRISLSRNVVLKYEVSIE